MTVFIIGSFFVGKGQRTLLHGHCSHEDPVLDFTTLVVDQVSGQIAVADGISYRLSWPSLQMQKDFCKQLVSCM